MALTDKDLARIKVVMKETISEDVPPIVHGIVEEVVQREVGALSQHISSFVDDNFVPSIDSLQEQIGEVRKDMKRMRVVVD